jgi:hypothetical protein
VPSAFTQVLVAVAPVAIFKVPRVVLNTIVPAALPEVFTESAASAICVVVAVRS